MTESQPTLGGEVAGLKQRTKGVPLLNATFRRDSAIAEKEFRRLRIAEISPGGQTGHFAADLFEKILPINGVEGVRKV